MLPAPLSIPCEIAPDFAKSKEVTATNTTLLADILTEFLVAARKSGAVAVYPPLVLDFLDIFVTCSLMAFHLFSADPPCFLSYDAHAPDLFCAGFPFGSWAGVPEAVFHFVSTWLTQHPSALNFCPHHPQQSYYATHIPAPYPPVFYDQADTSFRGVEARWRKMIANRSMFGHQWASMSITAGENKSDRLLEATLNRFWHRMTLNRTPMPSGGYAPIYLRSVLFCDGKIASDTPNAQDAKCMKFLGHSHTYGVICTDVVTSKDKRKSCQSGCQNKCSFCDGCIQVLHASTCTSAPGAEASKTTVRCFCGDDVLMVTLEGNMTTKGLQMDYIVLKVASPRSLQCNLSGSKTQRLPGPTAFTLVNFPVIDNGEDELVNYLETSLWIILRRDWLLYLSTLLSPQQKKDMVLTFKTLDNADAGRLFFNELKLESSMLAYAKFINICVEGKPWEVELGDNVATQRTLHIDAFSPKRDYDRLRTPSYPDVSGTDSKKFKKDMAVAGDFAGGSHNALTINVKKEKSEKIHLAAGSSLLTACASPPSTFTPLTLALPLSDALRSGPLGPQPMDASDDLLDALDLDIAPAGTQIEPFIPNSILLHPDVRNKFLECYRVLAEKHMAHLNGSPRHMIVWSFALQAKCAPVHVLFKYILEMKPLTIYVGTPPEARSNSRLQNNLHNICFAKTSHESKERCRLVWDYVTGKGEALKNKYAGVPDHQHPTFTVMNPMTNAQIISPQGVMPWVVKLPLPFIEGMYPSHTSHLDSTQIRCLLPPRCYFVFRNLTHCLLQHSIHTIRQGRIRKVLPHGVTHLSSEHCTFRWYPAHMLLYSHLCSTYFSMTFALNNVYVSSSAIVFVISALAVIFHDFAGQTPCASRYLYSTHFSLIHTLYALSMLSSASFSASSPATVLSLGFAGHTFSAFGYLCLLCFPSVYALDTVPMLSSASFLDRNLVTVISRACVGQKSSLTMRFDSGYALDSARCLSPCSLDGLEVFSFSFVTVPCLSRSYNTDKQPALLHWTVCLSLLQQILAHQNFSRVCTTFLLHHFRASLGRRRLLRQLNRGRKRLHTLNLELIQHHPFIETRTSPHTQPLSSGPPDPNSRPPPSNPSQRPHTQCGPLRQSSLPASALGKRPIPVSSNVDSNKKQKT